MKLMYCTAFGEVDLWDHMFCGKQIPRDVFVRGVRLAQRGLYEHWASYAAAWMVYQDRKAAE